MERLAHQPEFQLLEVAQPAVEHLRRAARGAGSEVARLDQGDLEPARGGIQGAPGAHHAAADDHDVELLGAESLPERGALLRAEHGNRIIRDEGAPHGELDVRVTRQ